MGDVLLVHVAALGLLNRDEVRQVVESPAALLQKLA
jgi:hypothetical protein